MAKASAQTGRDMMLTEALEKWVGTHPEKRLWTYLDDSGRETSETVTYRELDERTRALGRSLLVGTKGRAALSPGDRVLLVYPPSIHFVVAFVTCVRAGLVAVPVYPPDPRKLRKHIQAFSRTAASCGATVALTSSAYDHAKKASAIKARLTGDDSRWPDGLQWVVTDKALPGDAPARSGNSAISAVADESVAKAEGVGLGMGLERSSLAFLQYTSGSTGDPKGVKITHGNLAHNLAEIVRELRAGEGTVVVSWLPQYHDMGLIGSLLGTLYCGGSGYYLSPLDFVRSPPTWIVSVGRYCATHLQAPNFAFALAVRKWKALKTKPEVDLSSVVHVANGAEPIDAASIDAFQEMFAPYGLPEGVMKPTYGLAEHTVFVCSGGEQRLLVDRNALEVDKEVKLTADEEKKLPSERLSSSGPPPSDPSLGSFTLVGCGFPGRVKGLEILIVEPDSRRPLPEDRVGEVWLRSPSKAHGYWGLPERSLEAFCAVPASSTTDDASEANAQTQASEPADVPESVASSDVTPAEGVATSEVLASKEEGIVAPEFHSRTEEACGKGEEDFSRGFMRTGDEGFLHRGELFICGRIKDLVIIGGRNHYPQDLEKTAERDRVEAIRPGCSAAFSIPGTGDEGGELLVLTAEFREEQMKGSKEQRRRLAEEIRASVVSEHGVDVHHLVLLAPRANIKTTSGKIARHWCRRAFLEGKMKPLIHLQNNSTTNISNVEGSTKEAESGIDGGEGGPKGKPEENEAAATTALDVSSMSDEELLCRLQKDVASMGDGSTPPPDAAFYTLGLSSMAAAQFSGLLEQDYGARVPVAVLDGDDTTLRSLVPIVRAGGSGDGQEGEGSGGTGVPGGNGGTGVPGGNGATVEGVTSSEFMARETPSRFEATITNSCPCCMCLLSCPCCL